MKKIILSVGMVVVMAIILFSCEEYGKRYNYSYHTSMHISNMEHLKAITQVVSPKLNVFMELTEKEAEAEWESFYNIIKDVHADMDEDEYYTISLSKEEIVNDTYTPTYIVGSYTWGNKK